VKRAVADYSDFLRAAEVTKRTFFEALIFIAAPVLGLRPVRALRVTGLKVPKPMSWTGVESVGSGALGGFTAEVFLHGFDELSFVHEIDLIRRWFDCGPRQNETAVCPCFLWRCPFVSQT
jgi:hypothetical protein